MLTRLANCSVLSLWNHLSLFSSKEICCTKFKLLNHLFKARLPMSSPFKPRPQTTKLSGYQGNGNITQWKKRKSAEDLLKFQELRLEDSSAFKHLNIHQLTSVRLAFNHVLIWVTTCHPGVMVGLSAKLVENPWFISCVWFIHSLAY